MICGSLPTTFTRVPTSRLLARDALLQALVVHVKVTHWFFLSAAWHPLEFRLEGLVVNFQFVLHFFLFTHQILCSECAKVLALYFRRIKSKFGTCCLILDLRFDH